MIRATKIEIFGLSPERKQEWLHISRQMQRIVNRMWQLWLVHHVQNDSSNKIRDYLDSLAKWRETKQGDKPKLDVQAIPKELSNQIYHSISTEFTDVHVRTRVLLQNKWNGKLTKRKAANGNLSGWMAILLANESLPSSTKPQPIEFDKCNSPKETTFSKDDDGKYWMTLAVERVMQSGKSVIDRVSMVLNKRKTQSVRAIVDRILSGEYAYKGSSLSYDRGKWFANISYEMPAKSDVPPLNPDREIYLVPGKKSPWIVVIPHKQDKWRAFSHGQHVVRMRQVLQRERWSRQEHNRWGSSSTKGRGANRAKAVWTKLSSRWKDFTKTYNNEVTRRVVDIAVRNGCGTIVYWQPKDLKRDNMFLAREGRDERSMMTWDWFQVGTQLKSKAEE